MLQMRKLSIYFYGTNRIMANLKMLESLENIIETNKVDNVILENTIETNIVDIVTLGLFIISTETCNIAHALQHRLKQNTIKAPEIYLV